MYLHYDTIDKEEFELLKEKNEVEFQEILAKEKEVKTYNELPLNKKFYIQNGSFWAIVHQIKDKYIMSFENTKEGGKNEKDITKEYEEHMNVHYVIGEVEGKNRLKDLNQMMLDFFIFPKDEGCEHHVVKTKGYKGIKCQKCGLKIAMNM